MGCEYWDELFDFIDQRLVRDETISPHDRSLYRITDNPVEASDYISETARRRFGLKYGEKVPRRWWLFE